MGARARRASTALLTAVLLGVAAAPVAHRSSTVASIGEQPVAEQPIGTLEGGTFWRRLACVGCIGLIVGTAVELTPIAVFLSAASGGTMTAGCAFACTLALL